MKFTGFCAVAGEGELNRGRGFGDRSWCLLLTRKWLGYGGYDLADRVIYLMLRCLDYLKDWDMEDMIWLDIDIDIDIDIETKNWYFKFDFINIADNIR